MANKLNVFDLIIAPRAEGDVNLVDLLYRLLKDKISEDMANKFILNKEVLSIKDSIPQIQMCILNRVLLRAMLRYRGIKDIKVYGATGYLITDCNQDEWFTCMSKYVVPFLKKYNVLENTY